MKSKIKIKLLQEVDVSINSGKPQRYKVMWINRGEVRLWH
jgi:hypothetical protein